MVFINPEYSTNSDINNINRKISNLLSDSLNSMNISSTIVNMNSDRDKVEYINRYINGNNIIVTIGSINSDIEVIYGINRNDKLASRLVTNLEDNNFKVSKYYQRRSSTNTSKDYDNIISSFPNNDSIIIRYNKNTNREYDLVNVISNTIKGFLGLSNDTYIVKKGDTLYSIARKYNTSVDNIKRVNKLDSNSLSIGMKLTIPGNNNIEYIVKKGDTLYSISNKYNVSVKDIMNVNNLNSTNLSINQKLIIPK
jgi:LysM repeat protein